MALTTPPSEELIRAVADEVMERIKLAANFKPIAIHVAGLAAPAALADKVAGELNFARGGVVGPSQGSGDNARRAGHDVIIRPTLRSVHPVADDSTVAIAFDHPGRPPIRLVLDAETAGRLVETLGTYLGAWRLGMKLHWDRSSGMPNPDGSPNDGQNVAPLASSSAADCGLGYEPRPSPSNIA